MKKKKQQNVYGHTEKETRCNTPTFLLELPLVVSEDQARRIRAHLEAGSALYNAVLSAGQRHLRRMRVDPCACMPGSFQFL